MASARASAAETLLVGDSAIDLETAQRAGVACCLVSYGFGFRRELLDRKDPGLVFAASAAEVSKAIDTFINNV
jgi:phosphoglycolate phosphatase-like HAD superfamily hydrolase